MEHSIQKQQNTHSFQVHIEHSPGSHSGEHRSYAHMITCSATKNLSKFKKIEIISSIFSDHNTMRLEMNYTEKNVKNTNTWRLNNPLLNNQEITEEIKKEIKKHRDKLQRKHDNPKPMGCSQRSSKREVYSYTSLPQETRKIANKQPNHTPK